jgi:hypothetical protein
MTSNSNELEINNDICEGVNCNGKAAWKVPVLVGQLGTITLTLCSRCATKFEDVVPKTA